MILVFCATAKSKYSGAELQLLSVLNNSADEYHLVSLSPSAGKLLVDGNKLVKSFLFIHYLFRTAYYLALNPTAKCLFWGYPAILSAWILKAFLSHRKEVVLSERQWSRAVKHRRRFYQFRGEQYRWRFNSNMVLENFRNMIFYRQPKFCSVVFNNKSEYFDLACADDDGESVLIISRVTPEKNLEHALSFCKHFNRRKIVVFGRIQNLQYRDHLIELCSVEGVSIQFQGFSSDFRQILEQPGVFLQTSEDEGFPNALLEAVVTGREAYSVKAAFLEEIDFPCSYVYSDANGTIANGNSEMDFAICRNTIRRDFGAKCLQHFFEGGA